MQRWDKGRGTPTPDQLADLARVLYPRSPEVAARVAAAAGMTLAQLGLAGAVAPPPPYAITVRDMVDLIACAAADALGVAPDAVRPVLRAAFGRARDLGVTPADVARVLEEGAPAGRRRDAKSG
jgi:hypothetical protein